MGSNTVPYFQLEMKLFFLILTFGINLVRAAENLFTDCSIETYYFQNNVAAGAEINPTDWTRNDLVDLLDRTHRNQLPYTSSTNDDVWDALIDLHPGSSLPNTIDLIYSNVDMPVQPYGGSTTPWNREHLWPKSRGVGSGGYDFTDVHHLRPSNTRINSARSNKHFGDCTRRTDGGGPCITPAHPQAANDTSTDDAVFLPPAAVRGDVARALFYMDLRYSGNNPYDMDLQLTDCPTQSNHLGYLSELLEWHIADPVSEEERTRNDRVCERWQGNRNPFVDFPELATSIFGAPANTRNCSSTNPEPAPAPPIPSPFPPGGTSSCQEWNAGDIMVTMMNSDGSDGVVALVALSDLQGGADLYMTDNAWTGTSFRTNEGIVKLTIPDSGIPSGSIFGFGDLDLAYATDWLRIGGSFSLSSRGDTILLYCVEGDGDVVHISGFSYSGDWQPSGLESSEYGSGTSALPKEIEPVFSTALDHNDNYNYQGPRIGSRDEIASFLNDPDMWVGSDAELFVPNQIPFEVTTDAISGPRDGSCNGWQAGDVMVIGVNSDDPDTVAIVALTDLDEGVDLYMTDNAWTGSGFRTRLREGIVKMTIPSGGIPEGTIFGYGDDAVAYTTDWVNVDGSFSLSTSGDTILLYCLSVDNDVVHVSGFSYSGYWRRSGLPWFFYGRKSALPIDLAPMKDLAFESGDNFRYNGEKSGSKEELLRSLASPGSWSSSTSTRYSFADLEDFTVTSVP